MAVRVGTKSPPDSTATGLCRLLETRSKRYNTSNRMRATLACKLVLVASSRPSSRPCDPCLTAAMHLGGSVMGIMPIRACAVCHRHISAAG